MLGLLKLTALYLLIQSFKLNGLDAIFLFFLIGIRTKHFVVLVETAREVKSSIISGPVNFSLVLILSLPFYHICSIVDQNVTDVAFAFPRVFKVF